MFYQEGETLKNIDLINFGDVVPKDIDWLYYPYIPYGKITILSGNPGCGKTTFALALCSILSSGGNLPVSDKKAEPINIIYQTAEDGIADTIVPRLIKLGAEMSRIASIKVASQIDFSNAESIESAIRHHNAKLIVFDPLQAFVGKANMSSATEMRNLLHRIGVVAEATGCAVLIICHLNKNTSSPSLLYRAMGSIDIVSIARSALLIADSPYSKGRKILYQYKSNLATQSNALLFEISDDGVNWLECVDITENELSLSNSSSDFQNACDMLTELLENENVKSDKIRKMAADAGIGFSTLKKAKKHLNIQSIKIGHIWYYKKLGKVDNYEN